MATLSLTLPISCQICLGKVKDPVICPNNHAFCTVCLDMWLQGNNCCPTCRVDITKEKPYRKVLGSGENNETLGLKTRTKLRKTRLELLGREYETEIRNLSKEVSVVTQENKKLKEQLQTKEQTSNTSGNNTSCSLPNNIEAFSSLTKKLQEISSTYDDVRRDMNKLQEEKERLQRENNELKSEITRLKEDSTFTKSPKRYEKFTITGLKAKIDQYEKENHQLRQALLKSDKYVEQIQTELKCLRSKEVQGLFVRGTQSNPDAEEDDDDDDDDTEDDAENESSFPNSMVHQYPTSHTQSSCAENTAEHNSRSSTDLQNAPITSQNSPHATFLRQLASGSFHRTHDGVPVPIIAAGNNGEYSNDNEMFPATKKLLELKKIHETRNLSSSSPPAVPNPSQRSPIPGIDLPWTSCVSFVGYDSSSDNGDETIPPTNEGRSQDVGHKTSTSSETFACALTSNDERNSCAEPSTSCGNNRFSTSRPSPVAHDSQIDDQNNSDNDVSRSPKRNAIQPCFLNKKIKVENP